VLREHVESRDSDVVKSSVAGSKEDEGRKEGRKEGKKVKEDEGRKMKEGR
jgi:hypothetical protein